MVQHFNQEDFERLKHEVETLVGRTIMSPKGFEFLTLPDTGLHQREHLGKYPETHVGIRGFFLQTKRI